VEKVGSKITPFKWHCSFLLQVGYGTVREDKPFPRTEPCYQEEKWNHEKKWKKMSFTESLEVGSEETANFSFLMAWMKMCHLRGSN
jgi:hypothetical protein